MKKILLALLFLFLLFLVLTYWSTSVVPEDVEISKISDPAISKSEELVNLDSVTVYATNQYKGNALKRFMQGVNYRSAWSTPVKVPVAKLDTFSILKEGGGKQTHSLKVKSKSGILFSFRSVNKDPEPLIPEAARILGLENIVVDGISAQHPYGAILAAELAAAAGVISTKPQLVFVPQQKALGKYNEDYQNRLYLLEYETEGAKNWTSLTSVSKLVETDELQEMKLKAPNDLIIDRRSFVKVRLFDLLIGDWDRHAKQWGWAIREEGTKKTAFPIAGDRDNAFFRIDGVIPTILTNKLIQPMVRPFEEDIDHLPGFVYPVDQYFLHDTPKEIFIEEAKKLQQDLTDEKIEQAFTAWPSAIRELNEEEIKTKLKHRRDRLVSYAEEFHSEIQKQGLLEEPLKGSEDLDLPKGLLKCFDCLK